MLIATIILHSLTALLGLYLFILFVWWWNKRNSLGLSEIVKSKAWLDKQTPRYRVIKWLKYIVLLFWEHVVHWQKSATKIYNYTTGLMFGIFIAHSGAVWMYASRATHDHDDLFLFVPDWWPIRQIFMLAPLAMYAKHATLKIINEHKASKQLQFEEERRSIRRRLMDQNGMIK